MAVTKTGRTFQSSASNGAGSTTTGSWIDLRTALGCLVVGKVTNGGTGPTVGCRMDIETSRDGSTSDGVFSASLAASGNSVETTFSVRVPPEAMYARTVFTGNTGQAVTVQAFGQELTSI